MPGKPAPRQPKTPAIKLSRDRKSEIATLAVLRGRVGKRKLTEKQRIHLLGHVFRSIKVYDANAIAPIHYFLSRDPVELVKAIGWGVNVGLPYLSRFEAREMGERVSEDPATFVYWLCHTKSEHAFNFKPSKSSVGKENLAVLDFAYGLDNKPGNWMSFLQGLGKKGVERMKAELLRYDVSESLATSITLN